MNLYPPPSSPEEQPPGSYPGSPYPPGQPMVRVQLPPRNPWVVYTILGLTIAVFALQMLSQSLLRVDYPAALGMKYNGAIRAGQFWRLLTPVLLHGSVIHIGFNMYALYVIGPGLERFYGHGRFLLLYLIGGFAGNVLSFILSPEPSLGASTAIFGLIAAEGIFILKNRFLFGAEARSLIVNIAMIILINLALGLSPGIDNWGHLGGLIGGLAFAWFAGPLLHIRQLPFQLQLEDRRSTQRVWLVAALEAALIGGVVLLNIILG